MYKDPDKQREANRQASQRRRDKKGMTQGMTVKRDDANVIPKRAMLNGDTDISPVGALHQLIGKRKEGVTDKLVDAMLSGDVALADKCADEILGKPEQRTGINLAEIGLAEAPNDIGGTKLVVKPKRGKDIKPQSHSPMMVGYVPPRIDEV